MPRVTISFHSSISSLSEVDEMGSQAVMACGDVVLALETDHAQLVVVLPDVVSCGGDIPTILTIPRAKRQAFYCPSLVFILGWGDCGSSGFP